MTKEQVQSFTSVHNPNLIMRELNSKYLPNVLDTIQVIKPRKLCQTTETKMTRLKALGSWDRRPEIRY